MSERRRRPFLTVSIFLVLAAVAVTAGVVVWRDRDRDTDQAAVRRAAANVEATSLPAAGTTGQSTCADPAGAREWQVSWRTSASAAGPLLTATGLASRPAGGGTWTDQSLQTWELRWSSPPLHNAEFGTMLPEQTLQGPLTVL